MYRKKWNYNINSYLLSRFASIKNEYPLPKVKCPWGWTEFQHEFQYLSMDLVFQLYFLMCSFGTFYDKCKIKMFISASEDYTHDNGDKDIFFTDPLRTIFPSIAFVGGKGSVVIICLQHNGGTNKLTIHKC